MATLEPPMQLNLLRLTGIELSTNALQSMVCSISTKWKQPVGHFFIGNSVDSTVLKTTILQLRHKLESYGSEVCQQDDVPPPACSPSTRAQVPGSTVVCTCTAASSVVRACAASSVVCIRINISGARTTMAAQRHGLAVAAPVEPGAGSEPDTHLSLIHI